MAKTTELEAVNEILMMAGLAQVDTTTSTIDASQALNILRRISREIQSEGLHCNSEYRVTLTPNGSDEIDVAAHESTKGYEVLKIDNSDSYPNVCFRNDKMYDLDEKSYTSFTSPLDFDIVYEIPYEELPEHVRRYVNIKAGREFVLRYIRDETLFQLLFEDERNAKAVFFNAESDTSDVNMLQGWPANESLNRSPQLSYRW